MVRCVNMLYPPLLTMHTELIIINLKYKNAADFDSLLNKLLTHFTDLISHLTVIRQTD